MTALERKKGNEEEHLYSMSIRNWAQKSGAEDSPQRKITT